jgi:hypothetical protein
MSKLAISTVCFVIVANLGLVRYPARLKKAGIAILFEFLAVTITLEGGHEAPPSRV